MQFHGDLIPFDPDYIIFLYKPERIAIGRPVRLPCAQAANAQPVAHAN
jgi:hypothetical protein